MEINLDEIRKDALSEAEQEIQANQDPVYRNKEDIFEMMRKERDLTCILGLASQEILNDEKFMLKAISMNPEAIEYASKELREDKKFILKVISENPKSLEYLPHQTRDNVDLIFKTAESNSNIISYASKRIQKIYKEEGIEGLKEKRREKTFLQTFKNIFSSEKKKALQELEKNPSSLENMNFLLRENKEVVEKALESGGYYLRYASGTMKSDREIVLRAVSSDYEAIFSMNEKFLKDKEIMKKAVENYYKQGFRDSEDNPLIFIDKTLKNDEKFMREIIHKHPEAIEYVNKELRRNQEKQNNQGLNPIQEKLMEKRNRENQEKQGLKRY